MTGSYLTSENPTIEMWVEQNAAFFTWLRDGRPQPQPKGGFTFLTDFDEYSRQLDIDMYQLFMSVVAMVGDLGNYYLKLDRNRSDGSWHITFDVNVEFRGFIDPDVLHVLMQSCGLYADYTYDTSVGISNAYVDAELPSLYIVSSGGTSRRFPPVEAARNLPEAVNRLWRNLTRLKSGEWLTRGVLYADEYPPGYFRITANGERIQRSQQLASS